MSTWRLRQIEGTGWVEAVVDDRPIITGDPERAYQWPTRQAAEKAAARFPRGLVGVRAVEGRAFDRAAPRQ